MDPAGPEVAPLKSALRLTATQRWLLVVVAVLHGIAFLAAAVVVPYRAASVFTVLAALVGIGHLGVAVLVGLGHRAARLAWRFQSVAGLAFLAWCAWGVASTGVYLAGLYHGLGAGLAAALVLFVVPVVLFTVPLALWGLVATHLAGGRSVRRWLLGALVLAGVGVFVASLGGSWRRSRVVPVPATVADRLTTVFPPARPRGKRRRIVRRAMVDTPVPTCLQPVGPATTTVLVSHASRAGASRSRCLQGTTAEVLAALKRLASDPVESLAVKVDVVTGLAPLAPTTPVLGPFRVRPGLDGACAGSRCLPPWRLVASQLFVARAPVSAIADLRFGVHEAGLRRSLHVDGASAVQRIETRSFVYDVHGGLRELSRLRPLTRDDSPEAVDKAVTLARQHLVRAQLPDGHFRYVVHPMTGAQDKVTWSVARQAGVTLSLCQLNQPRAVTRHVQASLKLLARQRRRSSSGRYVILSQFPRRRVALGSTALGLVAFLACRSIAGPTHDGLIGDLLRTVLAVQRPDGSFHPTLDWSRERPGVERERLFVAGQAVLALVLGEALAARGLGALPERQVLARAAERAMDFYGSVHWPPWVRQFFFVDGHWQCLAAKAALEVHRHAGFEDFCLDYVAFQARLLLDEGDTIHPDLVDGIGLGNLVPPHATTTATFGEALVAAHAIRVARGEEATREKALILRVRRFLLRQQWQLDDDWALTPRAPAVGAWSESMVSPVSRIDHVQHAMAALLTGARALEATDR